MIQHAKTMVDSAAASQMEYRIPNKADFLLVNSTFPGNVATRKHSIWYIYTSKIYYAYLTFAFNIKDITLGEIQHKGHGLFKPYVKYLISTRVKGIFYQCSQLLSEKLVEFCCACEFLVA